jgi:8-oxo-dGTP diphosphatase
MPDSRTLIAIAIVEHDGRFLVGQRPPYVPLAGLWEFPGGKVQAGETLEAAAVRECFVESGLAAQVIDECAVVQHDYAHDRVDLHFFRCALADSDGSPREPFRWVAAAGLADLRFPDANRAVLDQIIAEHLA